jgi:hypothetical protein
MPAAPLSAFFPPVWGEKRAKFPFVNPGIRNSGKNPDKTAALSDRSDAFPAELPCLADFPQTVSAT